MKKASTARAGPFKPEPRVSEHPPAGTEGHARKGSTITAMLLHWSDDPEARKAAIERVYPQLRRVARFALNGHRSARRHLDTAELVNEAYSRLIAQRGENWGSRRDLFATIALLMNRILVDLARAQNGPQRRPPGGFRALRTADHPRVAREDTQAPLLDALTDIAKRDARGASIAYLRHSCGHSMPEIAELTGIPLRSCERYYSSARELLRRYYGGG